MGYDIIIEPNLNYKKKIEVLLENNRKRKRKFL
jgi:hypothetical protein